MRVRATWSPGSHSRGSARWPVPRQPSWVPSPRRVSSRGRRGPRGRARGGVQGGTPLASDASPTPAPWHRGAYGEVSFLEAGRCQAAGLQGFSRCRDPWTGRPRHGEGASGRAPRHLPWPARGRAPLRQAPCGCPTSLAGPAIRYSPLPWLQPSRSLDPLSAASAATGSASPATGAPRAAAARSASPERVPVRSHEARAVGGARTRPAGR